MSLYGQRNIDNLNYGSQIEEFKKIIPRIIPHFCCVASASMTSFGSIGITLRSGSNDAFGIAFKTEDAGKYQIKFRWCWDGIEGTNRTFLKGVFDNSEGIAYGTLYVAQTNEVLNAGPSQIWTEIIFEFDSEANKDLVFRLFRQADAGKPVICSLVAEVYKIE